MKRRFSQPSRRLTERLANAFTLVELIVVITILAILATVGFLTLSGYTDDARSATVAANVRTVYSAILTESTTSGNSPRFYVDHDPAAALSGAVAFADGKPVALTGGQWGQPPADSNYSAGNPRWDRLRMNGDKFRLSAVMRGLPGAFGNGGAGLAELAGAAYDTGAVSVGAFDASGKATLTGKSKTVSYFQVAGISPSTKKASVTGNYAAAGTGAVLGLVKDPSSGSSTGAVTEGATVIGGVWQAAPQGGDYQPNAALSSFLSANGYSRFGSLSGSLIATASIPGSEHVYVFFNTGGTTQLWASRLVGSYSVITERPHPLDAGYNSSFTSLAYWNGSGWSSKGWTNSFCLSGDGTNGVTSTLWISCPGTYNPEKTNWAVLFAGSANWWGWRLAFNDESGNMAYCISPNSTGNDVAVAVYVK